MRLVIILLALGFLIMAGGIAYALIWGNFFEEAQILLPQPWFHLSMLDLYVGFFLFGAWILFRESSLAAAIAWIVLLLTLGNLTACLYALLAMARANGDWRVFWMGDRPSSASKRAAPIGARVDRVPRAAARGGCRVDPS